MLTAGLAVVQLTGLLLGGAAPAAAAPAHDSFDQAWSLQAAYGDVELATAGAGSEQGEPVHAGSGAGSSVWVRWQPPLSAPATVEVTAVSGPALVAVYAGRSVDALTPVAQSEPGTERAQALFQAVAHESYWIAVDGVRSRPLPTTAAVRLLAYAPPHDDLRSARVLPSREGAVSTSLTHSTREPGEPVHPGAAGGTAWSAFVPPADGALRLRASGSGAAAPAVAVYTGASVRELVAVPVQREDGEVRLRVLRDKTYWIALVARDRAAIGGGDVTLTWSFAAPDNDALALARPLTGSSGRFTAGGPATAEAGEPAHSGQAALRSRWYRWTVPVSGVARLRTAASDARLSVYRAGTGVDDLSRLSDSHGAGGQGSALELPVAGGEDLRIAVDASSTSPIEVLYDLGAPANDVHPNAISLPVGSTAIGTTHGATGAAGDPAVPGAGVHTAWWSFVADRGGPLLVQTTGSRFDTVLAVYERQGHLRLVAADDDSGPGTASAAEVHVRPGVTYLVAVSGRERSSGEVALSVGTSVLAVAGTEVLESAGRALVELVRWPATGSAVVRYSTSPSSAGGTDFTSRAETVRFEPGQDSATVAVDVTDDQLDEATEAFVFSAQPAPSVSAVSGGRAVVRILDDDAPVKVRATEGAVSEAGATAEVVIGVDRPSGRPVHVQVATVDLAGAVPRATALSGEDYVSLVQGVVLPPGTSSTRVQVRLTDDDVDEPDEDLGIALGPATGAVPWPALTRVLLQDDEAAPLLHVGDLTFDEGPSGDIVPIEVPVRLSHRSASAVRAVFATADGTARRPFDYRRAEGEIVLAPGELSTTITIVTRPDNLVEGDEDFFLDVLVAEAATIGDGRGRILIVDDDD